MKHVGGDAAPLATESGSDASYESEDRVKAEAEILGQIYSLTGAGS